MSALTNLKTKIITLSQKMLAYNYKIDNGQNTYATDLSQAIEDYCDEKITEEGLVPPIEEVDPVFEEWKASTPPAYPGDIPTDLSQLNGDENHRVVTDIEKEEWNSKATGTHNHNLNDLAEKSYNSLTDVPSLDFEPANENIQGHIGDVDIHVTPDKTNAWDAKLDVSTVIPSLDTIDKMLIPAINEVNAIAKGAGNGETVTDIEDLVILLNAAVPTDYPYGKNFYVVDTEVPDYWISAIGSSSVPYVYVDDTTFLNDIAVTGSLQVGYYSISELETQKVNLTDYYDKPEIGNLLGAKADLSGGNTFSGNQNFDSNTLFIDSVNHRVGVGTIAPTYKLDVKGKAASDGICSDIGLDLNPVVAPTAPTGISMSGSGLEIGNYYYLITYYTAIGETSSTTSAVIVTTSGNQQVQLTIPCSTDARVIGRKIYRTKVGGGAYEDYSLVTINNNTATTYTDSTPDASLTDGPSKSYFRVNTTSKYITLNGNKLLMADTNLLSLGINAGYSLTTGGRNTIIGNGAGFSITSGSDNHLFGVQTGRVITSGGSNCGFGYSSLYHLTTGKNNTAYGHDSLFYNATGNNNTIMGAFAQFGVSGSNVSNVTAIGTNALGSNQGNNNVAVGYYASLSNSTGTANVAVGNESLRNNTTGQYNVGIGASAGWKTNALDVVTVMNKCIYIGYYSKSLANNQTNEIVIGSEAVGNGSNTVTLGNNIIADTYLKGRTHVTSSIQINNDTASASAANAGAIRYRADANNSYVEMCMQTGASTYAWIIIKQNTW